MFYRRLAALWVPDWPVLAAVQCRLGQGHEPLAIVAAGRVVAVSAIARGQGVRRGMRTRSAQEVCPDLVLVEADAGRDAQCFEPVMQVLEDTVPGCDVLRPGLALAPIGRAARYYGSEEAAGAAIVDGLVESLPFEAYLGIGDGLLAALLAAREQRIVPPGASPQFLASRPIAELELALDPGGAQLGEMIGLLLRLGIETIGQFAAMPRSAVLSRFGGYGLELHRLAAGEDAPAGRRHVAPRVFAAHVDLDPPVATIEAAAFAASRVAARLADQLQRHAVSARRLVIEAHTETGQVLTRSWYRAGASAVEPRELVRWQLEGWLAGRSDLPPSGPLARLVLRAEEVDPAGLVAPGLWQAASKGEREAARAAERLQGLLGPGAVLAPVLQGGREPRGRIRFVAWGDERTALRPLGDPWPGALPAPAPATVLAEPREVELLAADDAPVTVSGRLVLSAPPCRVRDRNRRLELTGWAGPWPLLERWWAKDGKRIAYLQAATQSGAYLLYARQGRWWLEAIYD